MGYLIVFIYINEEEKYFLYKMKPENELVIADFKNVQKNQLNISSES